MSVNIEGHKRRPHQEQERENLPNRIFRSVILSLAAVGLLGALFGCAAPFTKDAGKPGPDDQSDSTPSTGTGLIKPRIPTESPEPVSDTAYPEDPGVTPPGNVPVAPEAGPHGTPAPPPAPAPPDKPSGLVGLKGDRKGWEPQKVKAAALRLAQKTPSVLKIKLCYHMEDDEWWATVYAAAGSQVDVKQYTWSREEESFEELLVVKKIPKQQLDKHVASKERDLACEVFSPPFGTQ